MLLSDGLMMGRTPMTALLWTKVAFGLIAIIFNAICVGLVIKRLGFAKAGDFDAWAATDHKRHKSGGVVLIALVTALVIGGYLVTAAS